MTFVWKTTCRRLQSSGGLTRFAEGRATERESREVGTHLAACPSCQAIVADTLAVADLLKASVPVPPAKSLAASGNLWKTLEGEIARTPQDRVLIQQTASPEQVSMPSVPRLQRFGRWLSMPGAMPFGAAAAASIVVMVGIVTYNQLGHSPFEKQTTSAASVIEDSEFILLPSPGAPGPAASSVTMKMTESSREPVARERTAAALEPRAVAVIKAAAPDNELVILKTNPTIRRTRSLGAPAPLHPTVVTTRPPAPHPPAAQMAKAIVPPESFAASAAVSPASTGPAQLADVGKPAESATGFGGGIGGGQIPLELNSPVTNDADRTIVAPPASALATRAIVAPVPAPVVAQGPVAVTPVYNSENVSGEVQDVPASRSLLDMALRQRRQRSLFSYATR